MKKMKCILVRLKCFDRLKLFVKHWSNLLYKKILNLNIFSIWNFGSRVNRETAVELGQWSTRIYMVLISIGVVILSVYTLIHPSTLTKTIDGVTLKDLLNLEELKVKCPCSRIASKYSYFIEIIPNCHSVSGNERFEIEFFVKICSSEFVSEEWRMKLSTNLSDVNDYRYFLRSHLLFLSKLCERSKQSVKNSVDEFLSSLFVTNDLLFESEFIGRIDPLIKQREINPSLLMNEMLALIGLMNDGNGLISSFGTNFEYIFHLDSFEDRFGRTRSIVYDGNCSCGFHRNCTSEAFVLERNSSLKVGIEGLKIGCRPSEAFYSSTLQCFYNSSCIDLLEEYSNVKSRSPRVLSNADSRFAMNMTISQLVKELFIENWTRIVNYSSYFDRCSPSYCEYNYIQKLNSLYTLTLLLGLHGGLTIVLEWICPKTVKLIYKIHRYRKRRTEVVPTNEGIDVAIVNTTTGNRTPE